MTNILKACLIFSLLTVALTESVKNRIEELEKYIKDKRVEIKQRYRPHYHVAPPVGWLNDPNGFSYFNGEYHLFYQFYPYDSVWGPMHWGHVSSPDLVNWKPLPTALLPDEEMCFSGSAVVINETLVLMYTGHEDLDVEPFVRQSQYIAASEDGVYFEKYHGNPVISAAPNGSPDFRDPKAWRHGDYWYSVIGSKTDDDRGNVLLYRSADFITWEFLTVLGESVSNLGYMWECPDFFELDGKFVLLISPQGMDPEGDRFKTLHQTGYFIGNFNYTTYEFTPETEFQELDFGHDFYAAQTTEVNGSRYLVAWFNMWENHYPEAADGWAGMMTLVRKLVLYNNRIIMKPVEGMESLREEPAIVRDFFPKQVVNFASKTAEIIIEGNLNENIILFIEGTEGGDKVLLSWDPVVGKVAVVKGDNDIRQVEWEPIGSKSWRIFLDASSLELFCGEGEVVFSSRAFPEGGWKLTNWSNQKLELEAYSLRRSVDVSSSSSSSSFLSFVLLHSILIFYLVLY